MHPGRAIWVMPDALGMPARFSSRYVTDRDEYHAAAREIGRAFREIIGVYHAAMTAVQVSALMEARAKVEIEVTAIVPD